MVALGGGGGFFLWARYLCNELMLILSFFSFFSFFLLLLCYSRYGRLINDPPIEARKKTFLNLFWCQDLVLFWNNWVAWLTKLCPLQSTSSSTPCSTAAERKGNQLKGLKDFYLNAKARIWPWLSYMCHIRSTAACPPPPRSVYCISEERESSLLTTYWSKATLSSWWLGGPALRHGNLNSLFQVVLHLPS